MENQQNNENEIMIPPEASEQLNIEEAKLETTETGDDAPTEEVANEESTKTENSAEEIQEAQTEEVSSEENKTESEEKPTEAESTEAAEKQDKPDAESEPLVETATEEATNEEKKEETSETEVDEVKKEGLIDEFKKLDTDNTGFLDIAEIKVIIKKMYTDLNLVLEEDDFDKKVDSIEKNEDGKVKFEELVKSL